MLFNSAIFIFAFLPLALIVYQALLRWAPFRVAVAWLVIWSLVFYGWWQPSYLWLIGASILLNFTLGVLMDRARSPRARWWWLFAGIAGNLAALGFFKYTTLAVTTLNDTLGWGFAVPEILLPLGISFFTFTQIAYLVDKYRGHVRADRLLNYALFVTFFPHLIAGPVIHHAEMMPQFERPRGITARGLAVGLSLFVMGLAKKVLIADKVALWASPIFDAAARGASPTTAEAWVAALAYTFQIYFDFSGYSDMAIGLAHCFGIRFPLNFNSPYKAASIIDFWSRWHMTLSRFLRDYLYIPLGGNRRGPVRRYVNLMLTMLLGGLWHGAGWNFLAWGGLHGAYLIVNHAFRAATGRTKTSTPSTNPLLHAGSVALTTLAVVVAWVFFRAADFNTAGRMLAAMAGRGGEGVHAFELDEKLFWGVAVAAIVWGAPNTQEIMARWRPAIGPCVPPPRPVRWWQWKPELAWSCLLALLFLWTLWQFVGQPSEFIYYQF